MITYCDGVMQGIREDYPNIYKLFLYNRKGTLLALQTKGALIGYYCRDRRAVKHEGTDNYKAWSDYKKEILGYLNKVDSNKLHETLHNIMADKIHSVHFEKYPRWPKPGEMQSTDVPVDISGVRYMHDHYKVYAACEGSIIVTDERPNANQYIAMFEGKPEIKILSLHLEKLKTIDINTSNSMEKAKQKVDQLSQKELTWD